jgi:hypothetical protein
MTYLLFYTDPGSGVMLLQMLLATLAGAGFYFRSFFFRLFGRSSEPVASETTGLSANDKNE